MIGCGNIFLLGNKRVGGNPSVWKDWKFTIQQERNPKGRRLMANEFSIQIHDFLSSKMEELSTKKFSTIDIKENTFVEGQVSEIMWLREYLKENFDLKNFKYY